LRIPYPTYCQFILTVVLYFGNAAEWAAVQGEGDPMDTPTMVAILVIGIPLLVAFSWYTERSADRGEGENQLDGEPSRKDNIPDAEPEKVRAAKTKAFIAKQKELRKKYHAASYEEKVQIREELIAMNEAFQKDLGLDPKKVKALYEERVTKGLAPTFTADTASYEGMSRPELAAIAKEMGVPVRGTNDALIQQIANKAELIRLSKTLGRTPEQLQDSISRVTKTYKEATKKKEVGKLNKATEFLLSVCLIGLISSPITLPLIVALCWICTTFIPRTGEQSHAAETQSAVASADSAFIITEHDPSLDGFLASEKSRDFTEAGLKVSEYQYLHVELLMSTELWNLYDGDYSASFNNMPGIRAQLRAAGIELSETRRDGSGTLRIRCMGTGDCIRTEAEFARTIQYKVGDQFISAEAITWRSPIEFSVEDFDIDADLSFGDTGNCVSGFLRAYSRANNMSLYAKPSQE